MKILISGAGIAGPTLAYWLAQYGFSVTLVEKSPALRTGGYVIDFWGAGFDIAERMGLLPQLIASGYKVHEIRIVNRNNQRVAGFPADSFNRIAQGRFISLPRGDLAAAIFTKIEDNVEALFGDSIASIEQSATGVHVVFNSGADREFDLVIGADGLHSRVRKLVFGEQSRFEKYLGYKAAAFELAGYEPRDELVYVMFTEVGRQVVRFAKRDGRSMFLFTYADPSPAQNSPDTAEAAKAELKKHFANSGWECPQILDRMDEDSGFYFDRVSQIQMDPREGLWTRERVCLLGDAAFCVSLLAGQGSALAMVAAYILAGELHRAAGDHTIAFARYQKLFGPFILRKQKAALRFAGTFAPRSRLALLVRNKVMNLMAIPWIAELAIGRDLADRIAIPDY